MKNTSFCCTGCEFVHGMIHDLNLGRYYELKDQKTAPLMGLFRTQRKLDWLQEVLQKQDGFVTAKIHGVQCAACIWLIQEVAKKMGGAKVSVNTAYGIIKVDFDIKSFDIEQFFHQIQDFGYTLSSPDVQGQDVRSHGMLIRVGICAALSMNAMMYSASIYTGLESAENPTLFFLLTNGNVLLSTLAVLIGGSYFMKRAVLALKSRLLHFDLPIALGITLAYLGSLYTHFFIDPARSYFDTVTVFITLMLVGRFLQQRMIEKNKNSMIHARSFSAFCVRKKNTDHIQEVPFERLQKGDQVIVSVGTLFPVDCRAAKAIEVDMSWVNGEPNPVKIQGGERISAGATLLGLSSVDVTCMQGYQETALAEILTQVESKETLPLLWQWIAKYYVLGVLVLTLTGFTFWYFYTGLISAISVAVSIAVVTCPCSLGLAIPLARTLTYRFLMGQGVLIQSPYTLDHLQEVQNVAFDKTGTITLADLYWQNFEEVGKLGMKEQAVLFNAVSRSYHPASRAIFEKLQPLKLPVIDLAVKELIGKGLSCTCDGHTYFIGHVLHAFGENAQSEYIVSMLKDQVRVATIVLQEELQDDMQEVVDDLVVRGKNVYIISGDQAARVGKIAQKIGIKQSNVYAGCSPKDKEKLVRELSLAPTMYIGDGLNDQLAINQAQVSALSLHRQLQLSQKAHLYFLSQSMRWLPKLLDAADRLQQTVRFNLRFLAVYNISAVTLAMMGKITPLICAIIMPLSSIVVIAITAGKMKKMM